jgi:hypothetical protein
VWVGAWMHEYGFWVPGCLGAWVVGCLGPWSGAWVRWCLGAWVGAWVHEYGGTWVPGCLVAWAWADVRVLPCVPRAVCRGGPDNCVACLLQSRA